MCPWCFSEFDGEARYCPRCRHSLMYLPNDWLSAGDPMEIERCPRCEAQFLRSDDDCPGCAQRLRIGRGIVPHN